jgi:hypothetical protein
MGVTTFRAKRPNESVKKPMPATMTTHTWNGDASMVCKAHFRRFDS